MNHAEFVVGGGFMCGGQRWLCTDKGSRTVIAICIVEWREPSWYAGPPYAACEIVFDENDLPACFAVSTISTG